MRKRCHSPTSTWMYEREKWARKNEDEEWAGAWMSLLGAFYIRYPFRSRVPRTHRTDHCGCFCRECNPLCEKNQWSWSSDAGTGMKFKSYSPWHWSRRPLSRSDSGLNTGDIRAPLWRLKYQNVTVRCEKSITDKALNYMRGIAAARSTFFKVEWGKINHSMKSEGAIAATCVR